MLAEQRQRLIRAEIQRAGSVSVSALAASLGVSDMTVRRDLVALAERGEVAKVHGGAVAAPGGPHPNSSVEPGYAAKSHRQLAEKAAIADRAAELVRPGAAIGLGGGTTAATLAGRLTGVPNLTVVTNSLPAADILHAGGRADQTVVLTGGLRSASDALVGPVATAALRTLHLDLVFLGVHGFSVGAGFTTPNLLEAETNQALIAAGGELVVIADHTKSETVGMCSIAPLAAADILITDDHLPTHSYDALAAEIRTVIRVATAATKETS